MCLIVAITIYVGSYFFYQHGLYAQTIMGVVTATLMLGFFFYRIIKNRRCFFGSDTDCNKNSH